MKRLLGILLIIGLVLGLTSCVGVTKLTPQQIVKHEGNSSVALVYYDETNVDLDIKHSNIQPYCTGVWIDNTHIITAYHCAVVAWKEQQRKQNWKEKNQPKCEGIMQLFGACDDDDDKKEVPHTVIPMRNLPVHFIQQNEVSEVEQEPTAWHVSRLVGWDREHDLALLEVKGKAVPPHEIAVLADKAPEVGEAVHFVGHPSGFYWTYVNGTVAAYRDEILGDKTLGPYMQVSAPVYHGNSGGGAFDDSGKLVGIADAIINGVPNSGLYMPVSTIRIFLEDQGILPAPKPVEHSKPFTIPPA